MRNVFRLLILLCLTPAFLPAQGYSWVKRAGGIGTMERGRGISCDSSGNVFIVGEFSGGADFDGFMPNCNGISDIFVGKLDADGVYDWVIRMGGSGDDHGNSIVADEAGGAFFAASGNLTISNTEMLHAEDGLFIRLLPGGSTAWVKTILGDVNTQAICTARDKSGNFLGAGTYYTTIFTQHDTVVTHGGTDMFVVKYDAAGNELFTLGIGGQTGDLYPLLTTGPRNEIIAGGCTDNRVWYSPVDSLSLTGSRDLHVGIFDSLGNFLRAFQVKGTGDEYANDILCDDQGFIYITGLFNDTLFAGPDTLYDASNTSVFLVKSDMFGNILWGVQSDLQNYGWGSSLTFDKRGNVVVSGQRAGDFSMGAFTLPAVMSDDAFWAVVDTGGTVMSLHQVAGNGQDALNSTACTADGRIVFCGTFNQTAYWNTFPLTSSNNTNDIMLGAWCEAATLTQVQVTPLSLCLGDSFRVNYLTTGCFLNADSLIVELSDSTGSFSNPLILGITEPGPGMHLPFPTGITGGFRYRVRVRSQLQSGLTSTNPADIAFAYGPAPSPLITGDTLICPPGSAVTLYAGNGFVQYDWSDGSTADSLSVNQAGTYSVTVTDSFGCTGSDSIVVSVCLDAPPAPAASAIRLFPNPVQGTARLECDRPMQGSWYVFTPEGRLCMQGEMTGTSASIDLGALASGMYLLRAGESVVKFVKE